MNLVYAPRVEDDLVDAATFYEGRSPGLGEDFLTAFRRAVDALVLAPTSGPPVEGGPVRRSMVMRFPYAVYYRAEPERVLVLAVTHTRRHPEAWKARR